MNALGLVVLIALLPVADALTAEQGPASGQPPINTYREWVRRFIHDQHISGAAVALFDREHTIWSEGFGDRSQRSRAKVDPATLFSIQSISKTITATAVMLAVQDGLVELDRPVTEYLPDFTVNSCFAEKPERKITLRLMLGCAAGFTHEPSVGNNYDCPFPSYEAHYRSIRNSWLMFPVGKRYSYSNIGFDVAARVI